MDAQTRADTHTNGDAAIQPTGNSESVGRDWRSRLFELNPVLRSFLILVGVPTLISAIYYGAIASNIYVSETRYAIRTAVQAPTGGTLSAILGAPSVGGAGNDSQIVRDYVLSRDMLDQLESRLQLKEHYGSSDIDWFSRLPSWASQEDFHKYYRGMVGVGIDASSDITTLRVKAFDPTHAQLLAEEIIQLSEQLVNGLSDRIIADTLRFARKELELAEARVINASETLTEFRNSSRSIDPGEETTAVMGIVTNLESQLADARTELLEAQSVMRSDTGRVQNLQARAAALARQVEVERKRLASDSGTDLAKIIYGYEPLVLNQKLAEQLYSSALESLEIARTDAQRQQRYLIPFVAPQFPDESLEPKRVWGILTTFFGATLIFAIGGLIFAAIKDHAGI